MIDNKKRFISAPLPTFQAAPSRADVIVDGLLIGAAVGALAGLAAVLFPLLT